MRRAFGMSQLIRTLALAIPALLLARESFQPVDDRFSLSGIEAHTVTLGSPQPMYLEYAVIAGGDQPVPAEAVVDVNGSISARLRVDRLFAPVTGRVLLPESSFRTGANRVSVTIPAGSVSSPSATVRVDGRLHNYYGIAPDFPRVFVVADEAVAAWWTQQSVPGIGLRLSVITAASWLLLLGIARISRSAILAGSPSIVLWIALAYSVATPLHIWLSPGALLVAIAAGLALGSALSWTVRHPRQALRAAALMVLTLGSLEIALRLFNAVKPSFVFYADDYNRYRGRPGAPFFDAQFNARGFNDIEHTVARPPGVTRRIVAIGDSFVVGVVPQRFNYLSLLRAALGPERTEIVNLGVAGTEPRDYLSILVREGLAYRPDLVIASVFMGNDFEQSARKPYEYSFVATLGRTLWQYLRADRLPSASAGSAGGGVYRDDEPSLARDRFMEIEVDRSWIYEIRSERLRAAVDRVAATLRSMRDLASRSGAELVVLLIPDQVQIDPTLQQDVIRATGRPAEAFDFAQPDRDLMAALAADRIRTLDLLPLFSERGQTTSLYKPQDTHWNLAGNALAAQAIAAFLK
ncbi:MAG TPA: SGNH/GDSL hydrolase family protein [Vicinamibacterales bacterium]|nr:SGNH/GDSL hydrolase family protein [Vicinamibacterales bacterium]